MLAMIAGLPAFGQEIPVTTGVSEGENVQRIRFVEDDAQNYMVSRLFELKHQQANDIVPFVLGAVKRYANNGSVDRISYKAAKKQWITVTCPIPLMPYIADMIEKLDRPGKKGPFGSGIEGTGIVRNVYTPTWRSSERMMEIMIDAGIPANTDEDADQDAVVAFDAATNRIYWKDSINKDKDMMKYLAWLDRPIPQVNLSLNVYEVRESDLLDLGVDYLAWKNGPGLNLLDVGGTFLDGTALAESFGPFGYVMFAPSFDLSFIRTLQQNGKAKLATSARVAVMNGQEATLSFTPDYQNLEKDEDFASSVATSTNDSFTLAIRNPVIAITGKENKDGLIGYSQKDYGEQSAILNFNFTLDMRNVVERDNHGNELYDEASVAGGGSVKTGQERMLTHLVQENEVEQTIGVPFLCELPILKYIFGTTTRNKEKFYYFVTVETELQHPDSDIAALTGKLVSVPELVGSVEEAR